MEYNGGASSGTETNSYIVIKNNDFYDLHFGIWINAYNAVSRGVTITNNNFDYVRMSIEAQNYGDCKGGNASFDSYEISYNTITHGNYVPGPDNLKWEPDLNNLSWDEEGIGFQALTNSNVHNNYISGYIRGILLYVCPGLDAHDNNFYNNYIETSKNPIQFSPAVAAKSFYNNRAYYNILIGGANDGFSGVFVASNVIAPVTLYNYIYNNTMIGGTNGIFGTATMDYYEIKNNIIYGTTNRIVTFSKVPPAHVIFDYNLYKGASWNAWAVNDAGITWEQWKKLGTNYDMHSPAPQDPLFTNATMGVYTLTSSSPAKWAGVNVGLTTDYDGKPAHDPPSIGAFEYAISAPTGARTGE